MNKKYLALTIIFLVCYFLFNIEKGKAIPAFGRKYQISCQTCHSPSAPRLKAYGEEFAGNGYTLTEYESPRYFTETGDSKLSLIRDFPLAIRLEGHATINNANKGSLDFATPYLVKILSGGELSNKLSYYFYFYFNERGEIKGLDDAFIMLHDLFGSGINIYLGQFQICDPLFERELRLTLEDYHIYTVSPGNSSMSLKYDRGIMAEYSLPTGTDLTAMIVNGNGIGRADRERLFDKDKYKNVLFKVSQDFGDILSIGFFTYFGKEEIDILGGTDVNKALFYGPDLSLNLDDKLEINLQYLRRNDSKINLGGNLTVNNILTHGGFAELTYSPKGDRSDWYCTGLLNWMESDISSINYKSATFHLGYLLRRNIRLVGEYTQLFKENNFAKASFGFIAVF